MHPSTVHNYLVRSRTRKWNAAGEFKVQPVTFVDAEGNRIERVAAPDPLLSQPESESAHGMKEAPAHQVVGQSITRGPVDLLLGLSS